MVVYFHPGVLTHRIPDGIFESLPSELLACQMPQPESPERIANTVSVLQRGPLAEHLEWREARPATDEEILRFHTRAYLRTLTQADTEGHYFTRSTYFPAGALEAIRRAAGAAVEAITMVARGDARITYALVRPPGHHAQPAMADGYCFLNGIGIGVEAAISAGVQRIAVVDWDVHHGNGTQQGFYDRDDVLTISLHMDHGAWGPTHTQTGAVDEIGTGRGERFNINLPLPFGVGDHGYVQLFERAVAPALRRFTPDLIVLANGQDANAFDPNGRQCLTMAGYYRLARLLRGLAEEVCDGRIAVVQEGGYNPTYAPLCAYAVVAALLGQPLELDDPVAFYPEDEPLSDCAVGSLLARHPLL